MNLNWRADQALFYFTDVDTSSSCDVVQTKNFFRDGTWSKLVRERQFANCTSVRDQSTTHLNKESRAISDLLSDLRRALSDASRHVHTRIRARAAAAAAAEEVGARVARRLLRVAARPCCRTGSLGPESRAVTSLGPFWPRQPRALESHSWYCF
jgi:hypothetical protein